MSRARASHVPPRHTGRGGKAGARHATTLPPSLYLVTCEHAGRRVLSWVRLAGPGLAAALRSHRAWDPGALDLARRFARRLKAPLLYNTITRLAVDLNRTPGNPRVFSEFTPKDPAVRARLLREVHDPHWSEVLAAVERLLRRRDAWIFHVGMHTFTPVFHGVRRETEVGILFDPKREPEAELARSWQRALRRAAPDLVVHRNRPYRGWTDGLVPHIRTLHPERRYLSVELEVRQDLAVRPAWVARTVPLLIDTLEESIARVEPGGRLRARIGSR